jgi:hypothetical protein
VSQTHVPITRHESCRIACVTAVLYCGWLPSTDIPTSQPAPTLELTPGTSGWLLYLVGEADTLIDAVQVDQIGGTLKTAGTGHEVVRKWETWPGPASSTGVLDGPGNGSRAAKSARPAVGSLTSTVRLDLDDDRDDHRAAAVVVADPLADHPARQLPYCVRVGHAVVGGLFQRVL